MTRVGTPLVMSVVDDLWFPTFSDQVLPCFSEDARPRSNMLVCLISCVSRVQSDHSTEFCRGTAVKLNDKLLSSNDAEFQSIMFLKNSSSIS